MAVQMNRGYLRQLGHNLGQMPAIEPLMPDILGLWEFA